MKKINSTAMPQSHSFNSQDVYFAYQLLKHDMFDCVISLEKIGDIGIEGETNNIIELKNAQSVANNPLSNKSKDLWKSLYNWTMYFYENKDFPVLNFRCILYVNSKNECHQDIAKMLHECSNDTDFKTIIKRMKIELLENENYRSKNLDKIVIPTPKTANYYIEALLSKELYAFFQKVVYSFEIEHSKMSYLDTLRLCIKKRYGLKDNTLVDEIMRSYIGWILVKIESHMEKQIPAFIYTSELQEFNELNQDKYFRKNKYSLHSSLCPTKNDIKEQFDSKPQYIKQLEWIDIDPNAGAVSDYLKYLLERESWIENGYISSVDDDKLIEFERKQKQFWKRKKELTLLEYGSRNEVDQGKILFYRCQEGNQETLDNEIIDPVIVRGIQHEMADYEISDTLSIGWHPYYKEKIGENHE